MVNPLKDYDAVTRIYLMKWCFGGLARGNLLDRMPEHLVQIGVHFIGEHVRVGAPKLLRKSFHRGSPRYFRRRIGEKS
jgi:hypothetical protein